MADEKVDRLTMQWPPGLKSQVREHAGGRGLTGFVVEAVKAKLGMPAPVPQEQIDSKELGESRDLVQRMVDMFVRASDYEDPREQLLEVGLPHWIDTTGWPPELAALVPADEAIPSEVQAAPDLEVDDEDLHRPMFMTGKRTPEETKEKVAQIKPVDTEPVRLPAANDLFARVQAKAAAAGIDMTAAGLRPASSIAKPEVKEEPVVEADAATEPAPDLEREVDAPSPVTTPASDTCPICGSELVDGECWECM